jgi:excisionase family DNA binding protein
MVNNQPHQLTLGFPQDLFEMLARRIVELLLQQLQREAEQHARSRWLTFDQAQEYLGFSRDTLYKLTAARAIPMRKKIGGQGLRFHRDELDAWMETTYPRLDRLP